MKELGIVLVTFNLFTGMGLIFGVVANFADAVYKIPQPMISPVGHHIECG